MTPDLINGLFEFVGAAALALNVWKLYQDKESKGVHWLSTGFFTTWGFWNLFFYPSLGQMWSFAGAVAIVLVNVVWLILRVHYSRRSVMIVDIETDPFRYRTTPIPPSVIAYSTPDGEVVTHAYDGQQWR